MVIGIIPARYGSTRFEGKPLIDLGGMTMIQRVVAQAQKASLLDKVVVATDDERIFNHVQSFGGEVVMTSENCRNGTERCDETLRKLNIDADIIVNIQGDEPFIQPSQIDCLVELLQKNQNADIATLIKKISDAEMLFNPNIVKAIVNLKGEAMYFSRQTLPFVRGEAQADWFLKHDFYKHIGLYAYRAAHLNALATLSPSPLEQAESLEQLRWLENGYTIQTGVTDFETIGIDTPEDVAKAMSHL